MEVRRVNRPVFRISQPGEDVKWTTRGESPQLSVIRRRRQELAQPLPTELPTELPEATKPPAGPFGLDAGSVVREEEASRLPISSEYYPSHLETLSNDELEALADREGITEAEIETTDRELGRRGYGFHPDEDLSPEELLRIQKEKILRGLRID